MYVDRELARTHDEALIKVESIKKHMGWEPGFRPRSFPIVGYQALVDAEEEVEKTLQALVGSRRKEPWVR